MNSIEREFKMIRTHLKPAPPRSATNPRYRRTKALDTKVELILDHLDARGAWLETGKLKYHGPEDTTTQVIRSDTFVTNLISLATWLGAE